MQLLLLPRPPFPLVAYTLILVDLCKVRQPHDGCYRWSASGSGLLVCIPCMASPSCPSFLRPVSSFCHPAKACLGVASVSGHKCTVGCHVPLAPPSSPQALPAAFPAVLASAVRLLFSRMPLMDVECRSRVVQWMAHHL